MEERPWMVRVERLTELVLDTVYAVVSSLPCGSGSARIQINGKEYEILKLLGEGGFSLVYLIRDPATGQQYALKKIRCQNGEVSVREALAEVDAMRRFRGPNVIRVCDAAVVRDDTHASVRGNVPAHDEESGQGRIVYIVLPYYANGNLQDAINAHVIHASRYDEKTMLDLFLGACRGVQTMHNYALPEIKVDHNDTKEQEDSLLFDADSDAAYPPAPSMKVSNPSNMGDDLTREAYAHRDIKPATLKAQIPIKSRKEAIAHQDLAAERSSMPYRAPELYDVKTDAILDEKVDIWALGCTLYAMAYLHSPFETSSTTEQESDTLLSEARPEGTTYDR